MESDTALDALFAATQQARGRLLAEWLRALPLQHLPLQACCAQGGWVDDHGIEISVLRHSVDDARIVGEVAVFFNEVVGGCNCNDDPVSHPACGRLRVTLTRCDGAFRFEVLDH